MQTEDATTTTTTITNLPYRTRIEELSDEELPPPAPDMEAIEHEPSPATAPEFPIPPLFTKEPLLRDALKTVTSEMQDETLEELLPYLKEPVGDLNVFGVSQLSRKKHEQYLSWMLEGPYPAGFVAADASRPWMLYWALAAMVLLDVDVRDYRAR